MKIPKSIIVFAVVIVVLIVISLSRQVGSNTTEMESKERINQESVVEMEQYKENLSAKISENEHLIQGLKERMTDTKLEFRVDYQNRINELEYLTTELKERLDAYDLSGLQQWNEFKKELDHDLKDIESALEELTTDPIN